MSEQPAARRERRRKTWSAFGNLGRKPNEYEIVTHNMNHTTGAIPLEMGPSVHGNVWLRRYRDEIDLQLKTWDEFRDPDQMTYATYVQSPGRPGILTLTVSCRNTRKRAGRMESSATARWFSC